MITYNACPACSGRDIHEVLRVKDFTVSGRVFPVCHCDNCTLRFTQDVPGDMEIGAYYQSADYVSHTDTRKGLINKLYHLVRNLTLKSKRKLIEKGFVGNAGRILDYGCGTGAFLHEMKQAGWEIAGLEPDPGARGLARKLNGENIIAPDSFHLFPDNHFDRITLWHVLEHVHLLHKTMKQLHRVLKPGGKIFIAVPNYTSMDAAYYGSSWAAWDVPRHLYHFSPTSMKKLLPASGFSLQSVHPMWFDSFYVSMLSEKYKTGNNHYLRAFYKGIQSNVRAIQNKELCSSLIYMAIKE
jgi:SAM-dependent methyltransferase